MRENGHAADDLTTEIQAPPTGAPTQVDNQQVGASPDPLAAASAGPGERGKLRRRLRRLKGLRAKQRVELGTLVFDARKRSNGSRPEVVERRAAEAALVDRQVRELQHAVDAHAETRELVAGIAGSCQACGTILSTEDRFCPSCGAPTKPGRARPVDPTPDAATPSAPQPAPQNAPSMPTPARPLPANAPPTAAPPIPEPASPSTTETPAAGGSAITTESPAVPAAAAAEADAPPPPPGDDTPLAHVDRSAIPPPPPPPPAG